MKPPAFQFYAADFLVGTASLSCEQVGAYIRLLAHQWDKGILPPDPKALARLAGCRVTRIGAVLSKFTLTDRGYQNDRIEAERAKQKAFRVKQADNGRKRWPGTAKPMPSQEPNGSQNDALQSSSSSSDSKEERGGGPSRAGGRVIPSWEEVWQHAKQIGFAAEWRVRQWFNEMESVGWIDRNHRPIMAWRPLLAQTKVYWESDGRPMAPVRKTAEGKILPSIKPDQADKPKPPAWMDTLESIRSTIFDWLDSKPSLLPGLIAQIKALPKEAWDHADPALRKRMEDLIR